MKELDSSFFTWDCWRAGSIYDLGVICRYSEITSPRGKSILRKYIIGYCPAESLPCRPKRNCYAVMCLKDDEYFWFHLEKRELEEIFKGELV